MATSKCIHDTADPFYLVLVKIHSDADALTVQSNGSTIDPDSVRNVPGFANWTNLGGGHYQIQIAVVAKDQVLPGNTLSRDAAKIDVAVGHPCGGNSFIVYGGGETNVEAILGRTQAGQPKNLESGKPYRGVNVFLLTCSAWNRGTRRGRRRCRCGSVPRAGWSGGRT